MSDVKIDPFLTIGQVANIFQVKDYTVREWCKSGEIRATKIGGQWRIRQSDMEAYVNKKYGEK